jgi:hypothetical protein
MQNPNTQNIKNMKQRGQHQQRHRDTQDTQTYTPPPTTTDTPLFTYVDTKLLNVVPSCVHAHVAQRPSFPQTSPRCAPHPYHTTYCPPKNQFPLHTQIKTCALLPPAWNFCVLFLVGMHAPHEREGEGNWTRQTGKHGKKEEETHGGKEVGRRGKTEVSVSSTTCMTWAMRQEKTWGTVQSKTTDGFATVGARVSRLWNIL